MDSLRIDTGVRRIQINDGPEYIEFNPEDVTFAEKFYQLIKDFEIKKVDYQARSNAIDANQEVDANGLPVTLDTSLALLRESCEFFRDRIDNLFGAGTSQKVFGNALALSMFGQFFSGITPFIQSAREAKLLKYANNKHAGRVMK